MPSLWTLVNFASRRHSLRAVFAKGARLGNSWTSDQRLCAGDFLARLGCWKDEDGPTERPFVVQGDQVFIRDLSIKVAALDNGLKVMTGLISDSQLGEQLLVNIELLSVGGGLANTVRKIIRDELKPGRLQHRR